MYSISSYRQELLVRSACHGRKHNNEGSGGLNVSFGLTQGFVSRSDLMSMEKNLKMELKDTLIIDIKKTIGLSHVSKILMKCLDALIKKGIPREQLALLVKVLAKIMKDPLSIDFSELSKINLSLLPPKIRRLIMQIILHKIQMWKVIYNLNLEKKKKLAELEQAIQNMNSMHAMAKIHRINVLSRNIGKSRRL